ncbi:REP element-mobilizing transposase RayT [Duganella sp. CF458]|uniref:transposase n=1 Tax=Duganella sp. CF458 TaxID=1884368 RepID=UPI0008F1C2C3|nr:transposase [Duganella sp. CF458]SFG61139.1 REP element-mobilizing transposase RayT [Duganella sp. CF458]
MSRPLRTQFPGAFYHVTARGNRKANIFLDDLDYLTWHSLVERAADRFGFICHAYCQMPNHYHLLLETPLANLSDSMHFLNCVYSQQFNVRHGLTGHVLQGRFHSVLLEQETHFLELARYITLNPVRAGLVHSVADWRWSNYRATAGLVPAPPWLDTGSTRNRFQGDNEPERMRRYCEFVFAGAVRKPLVPQLPDAFGKQATQQAIADALRTGMYSLAEIASHFKVSTKTVQRIRAAEAAR